MIDSIQLTDFVRQWIEAFTIRSMHGWIQYVKLSGLSMPQFGILMNLHHNHTCSITDVSDSMDISTAAASQLVDKLVQNGLLERAEDPKDRRAKLLTLSSKGRVVVEKGIEARVSWARELVDALTPEEYESVAVALISLTRATNRLEFKKTVKQQ
ncbi:MAG TPA: MarR family transcriptional regulator [Anaerolineales bacterium]|jgi:DNA-binding MarR family transcriptional regulator